MQNRSLMFYTQTQIIQWILFLKNLKKKQNKTWSFKYLFDRNSSATNWRNLRVKKIKSKYQTLKKITNFEIPGSNVTLRTEKYRRILYRFVKDKKKNLSTF